jgi:hypothetical protein
VRSWSSRTVVASIVALTSGCPVDPPFSCDECSSDEFCWEAAQQCTALCTDASSCNPGHACVAAGNQMACDVQCDSALCPADEACGSSVGNCVRAECTPSLPCVRAGDACDTTVHKCYSVNGDCSDRTCYDFSAVKAVADSDCGGDGFCHLVPWEIRPPWLRHALSTPPTLVIMAPTPGQSFPVAADVSVGWIDQGTSVIAYILSAIPPFPEAVSATAIWGVAMPSGGGTSATFQDGSAIVAGEWRDVLPSLPSDRPLYFFAFALREGEVVDVSMMVPFRVGSAWAALGDTCAGSQHLPDDCFNPASVQACRDGRCRRVCASHVDCEDLSLGCAEAVDGVRICE